MEKEAVVGAAKVEPQPEKEAKGEAPAKNPAGGESLTGKNAESVPEKKVAEEEKKDPVEEEYVLLQMDGRRRSSSYIDPSEAVDFWKVHKECFMQYQNWEGERSQNNRDHKEFLTVISDCLFLAMGRTNSANQSLMSYFSIMAANMNDYSKQLMSLPPAFDPNLNSEMFKGTQEYEIAQKLRETDMSFAKSVKAFSANIEQNIGSEIKPMTTLYAKSLATQKESRKTIVANCDVAERRATEYFKQYCDAMGKKEAYVLKIRADDLDVWLPTRQYLMAAKRYKEQLEKYTMFVESLFEEGRKLEEGRIGTLAKSFDLFYKQHNAVFGVASVYTPSIEAVANLIGKGTAENALNPDCLFGDDPEMQAILTKAHIKVAKFKAISSAELKKYIGALGKNLSEPPGVNLEDLKLSVSRRSGLFEAWVPCIIYCTRDKYMHVFDKENDMKPVYNFDLLRSEAKKDEKEPKAFEVIETKKKHVVGEQPTYKSLKFQAEKEDDMEKMLEYMGKIKAK